jgi:hypothetical protein
MKRVINRFPEAPPLDDESVIDVALRRLDERQAWLRRPLRSHRLRRDRVRRRHECLFEAACLDDVAGRREKCKFHDAPQLANVARPHATFEGAQRVSGEPFLAAPSCVETLEHVVDEQTPIVATHAKRGNRQTEKAKPVIQIRPEAAVVHHRAKIASRRGDDPNVDALSKQGATKWRSRSTHGALAPCDVTSALVARVTRSS